jgi:hypothetical protein
MTNTAVTLAGASTTEGTSGGDPFYLSFAVMLSAPASNDVTVQYRLLSGTARAGDDAYYPTPLRSVTFAAGETSKTIDIRVNADSLDEPDEAVVLEVYSASDGAVLAGGATTLRATGWILDDDGNGNKLAMFASRPVVVEGDSGTTQAHFELWLSRPAPQAFTVDYSTVDGSAIAGEDYVASSGTISFVQGQTSASVSVPVLGDTAVEPSDLFTLAFTAPSIVAQASQGEATILDDDAGTPTVSVAGASTTEGTSGSDPFYLSFAVMLSAPASNDVTVQYRLLSGTARAGDDAYYPTPLRSVTFAAGETSKTIDIRVNADSLDEPDEAVVLEVYSASDGAVLAGGATTLRATGWILDDDGNGNKLAMFASRPVVVEGDSGTTQAHFELSLSRPAPQAFTVDYSTVDGSAIAGEDYVASSGTISFVQGQTSASVSVPVLGDTAVEPSDLFTLAFTAPSIVAQASQGEATILDDDAGTPTVSVAGASTTEGTSGSDPFYLSFAVMLSAPASNDVTVQYRLLSGTAQAGDDAYYPTPLRSVTFAAGETSKTIDIRVNADSLDEPDEAVVLEVYSASDGAVLAGGATTLRATGWILDDDGNGNKLAMFASRPVVVEGDSGTTQAHFELWLSRPAPQAFTVDYSTVDGSAIAGEDYVASSGTISFVQGQTSASVSVPVLGDTAVEPSDLFTLAFTAPSIVAQASQGEATILDDDAGTPTVSVAGASTTEGTSGSDPFYLSFAVMLSAPASNDVTVQYRLLSGTAQAGDDAYYPTPLRSVTFAAGETSKTIDIRVDADRLDEPDEAVVLEVYSASGGAVLAGGATTLRATGWILDDDDGSGTKLAMFTSRPVVVEGDSGTRQAHFELLLSRPAPQTFTVDYTTADGSAIADQDYIASSGTITFVQGQSSASVAVQVLGDTEIETDELFSLAVTFGGATSRADATIENDDYFDVTVPATLAPGAAGQARITYEHHTLNGAPLDINAALFFVTGERALVQDPFTGRFDDQVFLLSYGDGSGDIAAGETGTSDFEVNGTGGPRAGYTVSASIIDFDAIIDWEASIGLIRPAGIEDAAWTDLSERLIERFGTTGADFVNALAAHGLKLQTFGLNGESASAALAFLTDVVGDFGSIAGRAASGAMGAGWATLADIGLSFEGDTVILEGLPDLSLLRSLNPSGAAFYTISESASRASNLTGSIISDAPISGVRFVETEVGTYASTALTDVTLVDTSDGFAVEYSGGARLLFDASGAFLKLVEADGREITASRDANGAIAGFTGPPGCRAFLYPRCRRQHPGDCRRGRISRRSSLQRGGPAGQRNVRYRDRSVRL